MTTRPDLMKQLDKFAIDDGEPGLSFAHRLSRENGWSHRYAMRVVEEYKRFIYLAAVSPRQVTPSDAVDQAWHLHLSYTHSYWDRLCKQLLARPLHHLPTQGGAAEAEKFREQYRDTLELYRREFDDDPPSDIWPRAEQWSERDGAYVRVPTRRCLVLHKSATTLLLLCAAALIVAAGWLWSAGLLQSLSSLSITVIAFGFLIAMVIGWQVVRRVSRSSPEAQTSPGWQVWFDGGTFGCGGGACGAGGAGGSCGTSCGGGGGGGCGGGCGG